MARPRKSRELFVFMNGYRVGSLVQGSSGTLAFSYHGDWMATDIRRPISLCMPLSPKRYTGDLVYNFFDNLLPDSVAIRNRIQQRFKAHTNRCFDLLSYIGGDCVGALQLTPHESIPNVRKIRSTCLKDSDIASILRSYRTAPLGMQDQAEDFRISIAGAQEKTALLRMKKRWHRPKGSTPTSHIFKLPIGKIDHHGIDLSQSVENEWLCHLILKEYGLPVANSEIAAFEDQKVLIVERFDRVWAEKHRWLIRLPQEDLCQALRIPPSLKYESDGGPGTRAIMQLLLGSAESLEDRRKFLTAQFLFWLLAAIDGHAKNFSIFLEVEGRFRLTPLYDVISAHPLVQSRQLERQKLKMAMAVIGKNNHYRWSEIVPRHWLETAERCRFPKKGMISIINESLAKMDSVIENVSRQIPRGFPSFIADSVFNGMRIARERLPNKLTGAE